MTYQVRPELLSYGFYFFLLCHAIVKQISEIVCGDQFFYGFARADPYSAIHSNILIDDFSGNPATELCGITK
jgi:hypothetical protein